MKDYAIPVWFCILRESKAGRFIKTKACTTWRFKAVLTKINSIWISQTLFLNLVDSNSIIKKLALLFILFFLSRISTTIIINKKLNIPWGPEQMREREDVGWRKLEALVWISNRRVGIISGCFFSSSLMKRDITTVQIF